MTRARNGNPETSADHVDLVRQVLDREVIDVHGLPCGVVDDIELEGGPGERLRISALLIGPGAWAPRLPRMLGPLVRRLCGTGCTRVPWHEVSSVREQVRLQSAAQDLGLGEADRRAARWIRRLPAS